MKILYISPENTAGTLNMWKRGHEEQGNYCRYITFYPSLLGYEDDIVLNLPLVGNSQAYIKTRRLLQWLFYQRDPITEKKEQYPLSKVLKNGCEKFWRARNRCLRYLRKLLPQFSGCIDFPETRKAILGSLEALDEFL